MPMRKGYADHVFIVTSRERMALLAATNIAHAVENFQGHSYAGYSGIILNERLVREEEALVQKVAEETCSRIIAKIRRSGDVQRAE